MLTRSALFASDNRLLLDNPANFQNTMNVTGACYVRNDWCMNDPGDHDQIFVTYKPSYFSGYVFRGDTRDPLEVLGLGFNLRPSFRSLEEQEQVISGANKGITRTEGISTTVCASASHKYSGKNYGPVILHTGYVYLIDAVNFKGFAIPSPFPTDLIAVRYPCLRELYEVNFPNPIPSFKIVGIVWPVERRNRPVGEWPEYPSELLLSVNPYYKASFIDGCNKKGKEAASVVADRFNVMDWVLV